MLASAPAPSVPTPPVPRTEARYGFAGVTIGAGLDDLHGMQQKAACGAPKDGVVECLAPDQAVGGGYFARDLTYRFVDGRLAQIRFHSSIDGFAFVVAELKKNFGDPADIRRDNVRIYGHAFAHVAFTWRNGRSTIELSDPVNPPDQLAVRITLDAVKDRLGADPT